ncbi:hypothetical protein ACX80D_14325 [Arthrobacter sp. Sr24]
MAFVPNGGIFIESGIGVLFSAPGCGPIHGLATEDDIRRRGSGHHPACLENADMLEIELVTP